MPAPKNPIKLREYRKRQRKIALQNGYGKWMKGRHNSSKTEFKKGHTLRVGLKHTEKTKKKMSEKHRGKSTWNKGREYKQIRGENHWNWKGGNSPTYRKVRSSIEFRLWREAVFARDNWTCQICKKRGEKLHPHHIFSFSKYPELRFNIQNGITLCEICHRRIHGNSLKAVRK